MYLGEKHPNGTLQAKLPLPILMYTNQQLSQKQSLMPGINVKSIYSTLLKPNLQSDVPPGCTPRHETARAGIYTSFLEHSLVRTMIMLTD